MSGVQDDSALKLRAYLVGLPPQARARLRDELARGVVRSGVFDAQTALSELRRLDGDADAAAARLFFRPLEPFLVDADLGAGNPGQIARSALPALWAWVRHDLVPDQAAAFAEAAALPAGVVHHAERLASDFQDRVVAALRAVFADDDDATRRRVSRHIGTPRAVDEAIVLRWALRGRDTLAALAARLPAVIQNLPPDQVAVCQTLVEAAARPRDLFLNALLTVMRRLSAPWQILRLAVRAAGSNSAARIAETPYGVAVAILLADIERQTAGLAAALTDGDGGRAVALIRSIDATIQGVREEIVIPVGSTLGRRLSGHADQAAAVARAAIAA